VLIGPGSLTCGGQLLTPDAGPESLSSTCGLVGGDFTSYFLSRGFLWDPGNDDS
jgi:hypothetical protein